jgi:hypothetical protein
MRRYAANVAKLALCNCIYRPNRIESSSRDSPVLSFLHPLSSRSLVCAEFEIFIPLSACKAALHHIGTVCMHFQFTTHLCHCQMCTNVHIHKYTNAQLHTLVPLSRNLHFDMLYHFHLILMFNLYRFRFRFQFRFQFRFRCRCRCRCRCI